MSSLLLLVVTVIYACVMVDQFFKGNASMAGVFLGYTIANFALMAVAD